MEIHVAPFRYNWLRIDVFPVLATESVEDIYVDVETELMDQPSANAELMPLEWAEPKKNNPPASTIL